MELRIYYEDTDVAGVVYHANYLKYLERARTEYFRDRALSVADLAAAGYIFPVVHMDLDFLSPARHDDLLVVSTVPFKVGGSAITMKQQIRRKDDGRLLVEAGVKLACVNGAMKARRLPVEVRQVLAAEVNAVAA